MQDTQLNVGTFTRSVLIHLARNDGSLNRAGIDVHETSVTSSPAQFNSLGSGEFDLIFTSPDNVLAYRFLSHNPLGRNLPVRIESAIDRGLGLSLCTAPSIGSPEDLRGKTVGVDVAGSGFAFVAYALLEREGLHPGDYAVEALGSTPRRASALVEGGCAATILNAGNELRARGAGCTIVSSAVELGPYLGTVLASLDTQQSKNDDSKRRFIDVMLTTANEIVTGTREAEVVEAAMLLLGLTETEARAHHECLLAPTTGLIANGKVDRASIATLINLRRTYMPAVELDSIEGALSQVVTDRALT
jgi:ABC-type nitrate/sulfonate/bicarbonate transport system substrate-binding protein